ncbi:MAG: flagellar export protein FliJ [Phycisphaerae bacterium]|nr:flagellar export protein FliJ [Phycisphaerae bacterium]OUX02427.1 MAG: flagellar export protein FliJ [Phycisphaeraceae bacterium TMED231]
MPKFRFQLQAVLDARLRAEREEHRRVAELEASRRRLEDGLRRRQSQIGEARSQLRGRLEGRIDASSLRGQANASLAEMRDAQRVVLELAGIHRRLEALREDLRAASRARRTVEILKERRFEAWRREEDRREQAELDEMAVIRGSRRTVESL